MKTGKLLGRNHCCKGSFGAFVTLLKSICIPHCLLCLLERLAPLPCNEQHRKWISAMGKSPGMLEDKSLKKIAGKLNKIGKLAEVL
jgi:hypothetical protein